MALPFQLTNNILRQYPSAITKFLPLKSGSTGTITAPTATYVPIYIQ
jgi:hypothetical protein